jgi:hypothetical protein
LTNEAAHQNLSPREPTTALQQIKVSIGKKGTDFTVLKISSSELVVLHDDPFFTSGKPMALDVVRVVSCYTSRTTWLPEDKEKAFPELSHHTRSTLAS